MPMELSEINMLELLPQRPPMVMADRLVHYDEVATSTEFTVPADCIFLEGGHLTGEGLVENIAQTCAARMGYINEFLLHNAVKIGYIGAIRDFCAYRYPEIGEKLETSISVEEEIMKVTMVKACIEVDGETVCEAVMKIALTNIDRNEK